MDPARQLVEALLQEETPGLNPEQIKIMREFNRRTTLANQKGGHQRNVWWYAYRTPEGVQTDWSRIGVQPGTWLGVLVFDTPEGTQWVKWVTPDGSLIAGREFDQRHFQDGKIVRIDTFGTPVKES